MPTSVECGAVAEAACAQAKRRASQCEEHRRSDAPKSDKSLGQLISKGRRMRTGVIVIFDRVQVEEDLQVHRNDSPRRCMPGQTVL